MRWSTAAGTMPARHSIACSRTQPRDALALQTAHLMDFYRGDALNLRNRVSRVMPHWDASVPGHSYVLGMHAFGLEEMNQYPEAEAAALRALSLQPKDGWAVHAAVHVMEMQGRIDEGVAFLRTREADWAPDNAFAFHNFWHLALFCMDGARYQDALALFDRHVHPEPAAYILSLVDATALLWRLHLEGVDVGDRVMRIADDWEARLRQESGLLRIQRRARGDGVRDGRTRRRNARARCAHGRRGAGADPAAARSPPRSAFRSREGSRRLRAAGTPNAIDAIEPVRDTAHRFGGSHAQRDLLTLTLIEAAIRAGDGARARHYTAERRMHKPAERMGRALVEARRR